ncbi:MAG: ABC transporter ATP-binding protein [Thermomicrobiales bacterium]
MLETQGITKQYGSVVANDRLSISIPAGEIVGLLGENGAGKSTLLSVLSGMVQPDEGYLVLDGNRISFRSPGEAIRYGIGTVYQHFSLVPTLTVREQLRIAGWRSPHLPPLLQGTLSGNERIDTLSLGERQRVEIAKALIATPRVLLLDEPTSILAPTEISQLFDLLRGIRDRGTSIVLVTHKLHEAIELSDRIVVLRRGAVAGEAERPSTGWKEDTQGMLLRLMFEVRGDDTTSEQTPVVPEMRDLAPVAAQTLDRLLEVRHLSTVSRSGWGRHGEHLLRDILLDVPAGAICAIVGIDGQGQRELAEVLTGYRPADGEIALGDRRLEGESASTFARAGIGYLTDDRQHEGGIGSFSVAMNLVLKRQRQRQFSRFGMLRRKAIGEEARHLVSAWSISPANPTSPLGLLSGGNIQKVLLAREMAMSPKVLIANKPTHGLDAKTQEVVWQAMRAITRRDGGGGVLFFTTDIDEALCQADQVAVIANGRVSPFVPSDDTDRLTLATMMVSGW